MENLTPTLSPEAKLKAYVQLFRLPNVFTALADVLMGYLFTHAVSYPTTNLPAACWLLLLASGAIYTAGMTLNDAFDVEQDRAQRPHRPLPSGRISPVWAKWLGFELLVVGAGLACGAGALAGQLRTCWVALSLALAVVLYDAVLKKTPLAPLVMGSCRFLNVLLGMSVTADAWEAIHYLVAAGVGTYIVGVTWYARTEAVASNRWQLALGLSVMLGGLALLAAYPQWVAPATPSASLPQFAAPGRWPLVWAVLATSIGWRGLRGVAQPTPANVQAAVKSGILSLIVIDALVIYSVRDLPWAAATLLLLVPTLILGRWAYST